jgi:hypothetical protein
MSIRCRAALRIAGILGLALAGLGSPMPAAAADSPATIASYEHGDLAGSGAPYTVRCTGLPSQTLACRSVANLDTITGPCKPWPWSGSTWNDCISSVYFQNYTGAYLQITYYTDANYGGIGWPYCVGPQSTWNGSVLSLLNDRYSSLRATYSWSKPAFAQGNC